MPIEQSCEVDLIVRQVFEARAFQPIDILEDQVTRGDTDESGRNLTIFLPIAPNSTVTACLRISPSTFSSAGPPDYKFNSQKSRFELGLTISNPDKAQAAWEDRLARFKEYIGWRNRDIEKCNRKLRSIIEEAVTRRIEALEQGRKNQELINTGLKIPLATVASARPVDISVKKPVSVIREASSKPKQPGSPYVEESMAADIIETANSLGKQFEVAPKAYSKLGEEDLRHILLGTLNAVFKMKGKAEAFNRKGKTDIFLDVPSGSGFIAECKFWSGEVNFLGTLDQLLGYVDWRKSYAVAIIFSNNKSITGVIEVAKRALAKRGLLGAVSVRSEGHLVSQHNHPRDAGKSIELHCLFFDLSHD
jgi:hypothetical protein